MGNYNDVPRITKVKYLLKYPLLSAELRLLLVENGLCEEQFAMLVKMGLEEDPGLRAEIIRSFEGGGFSWMEVLNHDAIGEVYESDTEEEALEFATKMFLKPAKN